MEKRIVKALNRNHEVVSIIQIRRGWWIFKYWDNYSKTEYLGNNKYRYDVIEFHDEGKAKEALDKLEDIKVIL